MTKHVGPVAVVAVLALTLTAAIAAGMDSPGQSSGATPPVGMILIPRGSFTMGYLHAYDDERPVHQVTLRPFFLDSHEVTNVEFQMFTDATGYVTQAERDGRCWAYIQGASNWDYAEGVNWRHPQGPESSIDKTLNHPVVCVNWFDASAYARWAGKRLPTEAEWEYAARAGSIEQYVADIGHDDRPDADHAHEHHAQNTSDYSPSAKSHQAGTNQHHDHGLADAETAVKANVWEGSWPTTNLLSDSYYYTAPVASFSPNGWGVYDMVGNVWEWTADWYDSTYYAHSPESDPLGAGDGTKRVARGGSWFCSPNYCGAYSTHYRGASPPDHAFNNVGFRCAMDVPSRP